MFDLFPGKRGDEEGKSVDLTDSIDRLHFKLTSSLLILFAVIVGGCQYMASPIHCMTPAQFPETWQDYLDSYCLVTGTFYLPVKSNIEEGINGLVIEEAGINYYQWIPFILMVQAFLFHLPQLLWKQYTRMAIVDMATVVEEAMKLRLETGERRLEKNGEIVAYIEQYLHQGKHGQSPRQGKKNRFGSSMLIVYLLMKSLNMFNCLLQLHFISIIVGFHSSVFFGFSLLGDLMNGIGWTESGIFPRVTFCTFQSISILKSTVLRTVQCVLPINLLNEKIFLILWFWFFFVALVSLFNCIQMVVRILLPCCRRREIEKMIGTCDHADHIKASQRHNDNISEHSSHLMLMLSDFIFCSLRLDGVLLLFFLRQNAGPSSAGAIVSLLWHRFAINNQSIVPVERRQKELSKVIVHEAIQFRQCTSKG